MKLPRPLASLRAAGAEALIRAQLAAGLGPPASPVGAAAVLASCCIDLLVALCVQIGGNWAVLKRHSHGNNRGLVGHANCTSSVCLTHTR